VNMAAESDVIKDCRTFKEFDLLKCPGDPHFCSLIRSQVGDPFFFEIDFASLGMVKTINAIKENRFPGSVGANDGKDLALFNLEGYTH
jgi:hypothetical protein